VSVIYSPPGSRRVRGVQRAQAQTIKRLCGALLRYNTKVAARVPAQPAFLNGLNLASTNAMVAACTALLDQVN
jgi:hypothetical protein